jgi:lactose/L-arabinose transport system permease protein
MMTRSATAARIWRARWPLLFISPFFILFAIFYLYPFVFSIILSVSDWKGPGDLEFVGLRNFQVLLRDGRFWGSMTNAVIIFFVYVPLMTALATVLAVVLDAGLMRLQGLWRSLIFLPNITSMVAAGFTFKLLLDYQSGYVNSALGWLGIPAVPWLDDVWWARISVGMLVLWAWLGFNTVIMLAGLQTIPRELGEAAQVDGATRRQVFRHVTLPLLRPQIVFSVTLSVIGTFSLYTEPYILTKGGPAAATETPAMRIFAAMFQQSRYGYAAAMGVAYLVIVVAVTLVQFRASRGDGRR